MTNELFNGNTSVITIDPNKDYSAELIGEGKKYASIQEAARAILEKDLHINRVQTEAKELREDLSKRNTAEELLEKLKQQSNNSSNQSNSSQNDADGTGDTKLLKAEDIDALIKRQVSDAVSHITVEAEAKKNVELVRNALTQLWGEEYSSVLETKAKELGVSKDWITNAARTTPKVLLTLVSQGEKAKDKEQASLFAPSLNGINSAGLARSSSNNVPDEGKYSYWQKLRKDNPNQYHSVSASAKRHAAAQTYGETFYNN